VGAQGQQLLRRIRVEIIRSQAHAYALCRRACVDCGRPKRIKDIRSKCVQTVLGAFLYLCMPFIYRTMTILALAILHGLS
jgi:hypothetical protein